MYGEHLRALRCSRLLGFRDEQGQQDCQEAYSPEEEPVKEIVNNDREDHWLGFPEEA